MNQVRDIRAGKKPFKRAYVGIFLWFTGRAIQAAARVDEQVKKEFDNLPDDFTFSLGCLPGGPWMVLGKEKGAVRYLGGDPGTRSLHVRLAFKSVDAAFLVLSFQESTALATARNRLITEGEISYAMAVIRILDIVEAYLLPRFIAARAVKRYPRWSLRRKLMGGVAVYTRTLLGF